MEEGETTDRVLLSCAWAFDQPENALTNTNKTLRNAEIATLLFRVRVKPFTWYVSTLSILLLHWARGPRTSTTGEPCTNLDLDLDDLGRGTVAVPAPLVGTTLIWAAHTLRTCLLME